MAETSDNVYRINDIEYIYDIIMFNNEDKFTIFTQDAIKLLVIEDTIENPFSEGYMIVNNTNNVLQRKYKIGDVEIDEQFDFNMGDKDYVSIKIVPKFTQKQEKGDIDEEIWALSYLFVVTEIEDLDTEGAGGNIKKFYLMDYQQYEMMNKTSNLSTATMQNIEKKEYLRDDNDRVSTTGDILKQIITLNNPNASFSNIWDTGGNKIFYTSPINNTYYKDLISIYSVHQSSVTNDFCILSKKRFTETWVLEKFEDIVEKSLNQSDKNKAGDYLLEAFYIADTANTPTDKIPKKTRVPTDYGVDKNFSFGDLSKIENFKLTEISRQDINDEFKTVIIHSYDFEGGKFKIQHDDINDTKSFYDTSYMGKLNSQKSLFNPSENQIANLNVDHTYGCSYLPDTSFEFLGRNEVLKSAYLLGLAMEFDSVGMTHRQSGTFFSVRKNYNYYDNEFEGKLQGIWFCTGVTHIFSGNTYTNNLVGIKLNKS
jgi:hypothetical protein